jgi:hypothetical protein
MRGTGSRILFAGQNSCDLHPGGDGAHDHPPPRDANLSLPRCAAATSQAGPAQLLVPLPFAQVFTYATEANRPPSLECQNHPQSGRFQVKASDRFWVITEGEMNVLLRIVPEGRIAAGVTSFFENVKLTLGSR